MDRSRLRCRTAWVGVGLGAFRPCPSTYALYSFEELPPLPQEVRGDLRWLDTVPAHTDGMGGRREEFLIRLKTLKTAARGRGVTLPEPFESFMRSSRQRAKIRSCTACYFDLPDRLIEAPDGGGELLRFLCDSQGCYFWSLYLERGTRDHCVVASWMDPDWGDDEEPGAPFDPGLMVYCSPDFESFLYRFWIENEIWYALTWPQDKRALTQSEEAYVNHDLRKPQGPTNEAMQRPRSRRAANHGR